MTEQIEIKAESDIVLARQAGRLLARQTGFGVIVQSRITTAISELARNIFLYAGQGLITLEIVEAEGKTGIRITAIDQGPGISDLRKALEDGYSTSGALGAGLPAVRRMMDHFSIESRAGAGTRVEAIKWME